jgi:alpha-beta hydrolase superfamily lysophospholipase
MYEAGFLRVADVAYAVIAARKVLGAILSNKRAVFGHSEGGMTAWRTVERLALPGQERLLKAGKFIGGVAAAPALRPQRLIPLSWQ